MLSLATPNLSTWAIAFVATLGVIIPPYRVPEAIWAVIGAVTLVVAGLLSWPDALRAIGKGTDVYLFLTGMMLLAEMARQEGLFDHIAARAVNAAQGSPRRLFTLTYVVGTAVTILLSNDATAVVLTPAVFAAAKAAKAKNALPYLFVCAFIANAASFVLPISNPANLVVFRDHMPHLFAWLARFGLASILSIGATYGLLRFAQRGALTGSIERQIDVPELSAGGRLVAYGIGGAGVALLVASGFGIDLGWPTCLAAAITLAMVALRKKAFPSDAVKGVSWAVLPLVAGLFVLVEGLDQTGILTALANMLRAAAVHSVTATAWGAGAIVAFVCNIMNNLPAGLLTGAAVSAARAPDKVAAALLIGVDLGPNLSVTGSLATILWLVALRREGLDVSFWRFLQLGAFIMPPALLLAIGAVTLTG
jgi:arsenical pump membrane protein